MGLIQGVKLMGESIYESIYSCGRYITEKIFIKGYPFNNIRFIK